MLVDEIDRMVLPNARQIDDPMLVKKLLHLRAEAADALAYVQSRIESNPIDG
jgi:hypothetical protein